MLKWDGILNVCQSEIEHSWGCCGAPVKLLIKVLGAPCRLYHPHPYTTKLEENRSQKRRSSSRKQKN